LLTSVMYHWQKKYYPDNK